MYIKKRQDYSSIYKHTNVFKERGHLGSTDVFFLGTKKNLVDQHFFANYENKVSIPTNQTLGIFVIHNIMRINGVL